jgi:hypothetical protein
LRKRLNEYGDINRKVVEYENKLAFSHQEIDRLGQNLKLKNEDAVKLDQLYRNSAQEV